MTSSGHDPGGANVTPTARMFTESDFSRPILPPDIPAAIEDLPSAILSRKQETKVLHFASSPV